MFSICRAMSQWNPNVRVQVGDLSLQYGGYWSDHLSHQNGLDGDLRYLMNSDTGALDLRFVPNDYDPYATVDLLNCLLRDDNLELILIDTLLSAISSGGEQRILHDPDHYNHFHVRVRNPTGYGGQ